MDNRIKQIRESEKKSHIEMYSNEELYKSDSWLKKPIKTVQELIPMFEDYKKINVLDLGCGVGRNSIPIACKYKNVDCTVDCVDILELTIEKLYANAKEYDIHSNIHGVINMIEAFAVKEKYYDFIIAVSSLEHVESEINFVNKLVTNDGVFTKELKEVPLKLSPVPNANKRHRGNPLDVISLLEDGRFFNDLSDEERTSLDKTGEDDFTNFIIDKLL